MTDQLREKIEREAEIRGKSQWCKESDEYARESVKGYVEPQKGVCYYERALGYEDGIESGFKQGCDFAMEMDRWVKVEPGCKLPGKCLAHSNISVDVLVSDGMNASLGYYDYKQAKWVAYKEPEPITNIRYYQPISPPQK